MGVGVRGYGRPQVDVAAGCGQNRSHTRPTPDNAGWLAGVQITVKLAMDKAGRGCEQPDGGEAVDVHVKCSGNGVSSD